MERTDTKTTQMWRRAASGLSTLLLACFVAAPAAANDTTPKPSSVNSAGQHSDEAADSTESAESGSSDEGSADGIASSANTGLDLGSESISAKQALAHVDRARSDKETDADEESSGSDDSESSSLSTSTNNSHPCEPYPSCARADLGSKNGVDPEPFLNVAEAHNDEIRSCFEQAVDGTPEGRLVLQFEIGADGAARKIQVQSATVEMEGFGSCAAKQVQSWSFPKPSEFGYDSLKVSHPYTFGSE